MLLQCLFAFPFLHRRKAAGVILVLEQRIADAARLLVRRRHQRLQTLANLIFMPALGPDLRNYANLVTRLVASK